MSVVTNTEAPSENGPTERCNATIEEQYELARESFEPQTETESDELIVQGCIPHNQYSDRSRSNPYERVFGVPTRMPRSLTNDDALETSEVTEGPAVDYQRAHVCRVAAATTFKLNANNRIAGASAARSVVGYRPKVGGWVMVHRYNRTSTRRWRVGLAVVVLVSGSTCWGVSRSHLLKLTARNVMQAAART